MKRKHMESHWKQMVAEQAAREKRKGEPPGRKTQGKKKAKKEDAPEIEVNAETEDVLEDEQEVETEDRKSPWKSAGDLLHRHRYASLAVTVAVLLICLLTTFGDSDDRPERVPVSGRVLIDDEPLTAGTIIFIPEDGVHSSIGTIDKTGHFTLTCYDGDDGAVLGMHRMEVVLTETLDEDAPPWLVPEKYTNHQTSKLAAEITKPTRDLIVRLQTDREQSEGETEPDPSQLSGEGEQQ